MQKMQNKSGPGDGLLQETEHSWLCNGAGRQPDNSCHSAQLADWTGQLDNLLVNEAALCELTGFKTAKLLLTEVDRHGTAALCFRHRCDVRVATSHKHKQWSGSAASQSTASTQLSLSASQASPAEVRTPQECQFEACKACVDCGLR